MATQQSGARLVPLSHGDIQRRLPITVMLCSIGTTKEEQMHAVQLAHGCSLVQGRAVPCSSCVQICMGIAQNLHHRSIAISARENERCCSCVVWSVDLCPPLQEEHHALRCAACAGVVESTSTSWVDDIDLTLDFSIELHEEEVAVQSRLKNVRGGPRILPQRHADNLVSPVSRWLPFGRSLVCDLLPLTQDVRKLRRLSPLRDLPCLAVEEEPPLSSRDYSPPLPSTELLILRRGQA
mmetsp:Transcript_47682/g.103700  ORF Transcript_47682/g.103700 Transcript_47682/m.103700 type:complete len:238 (+) Transcript_47682:671-1384(+)